MISFIFSFEISNNVTPDANIFLWIAPSVADAAAVNPNGIETLLTNGLSTFLIKGNPVFINGPKTLSKTPPECPILCNWFFDNCILAEELFAKALRSFRTYILVNNSLWGKLFSSLESPTTFDGIFKVTSVPFFTHNCDCELGNFTFKVL